MLPEARSTPVIENCAPMKPHDSAMMRRYVAPAAMTPGSFGTKKATSCGATKNAITPMRRQDPEAHPRAEPPIRAARSMLPAPMFWPTSAETAIDSPIAGIITTWSIVEPTPYAATVSVPKLVMRKVSTVRPSARADCSIDAGKPRKNARLM